MILMGPNSNGSHPTVLWESVTNLHKCQWNRKVGFVFKVDQFFLWDILRLAFQGAGTKPTQAHPPFLWVSNPVRYCISWRVATVTRFFLSFHFCRFSVTVSRKVSSSESSSADDSAEKKLRLIPKSFIIVSLTKKNCKIINELGYVSLEEKVARFFATRFPSRQILGLMVHFLRIASILDLFSYLFSLIKQCLLPLGYLFSPSKHCLSEDTIHEPTLS